jgi:hypothetical protein
MTLLEKARRVYAFIIARRNGHAKQPLSTGHGYEINELNELSPPAGGLWLAPGLTAEDARTPFDAEPEREAGEEG